MQYLIYLIVISVFVLRLFFLKISKRNEKAILEAGGSEYGVKNTKRITILHILFYLCTLIEAIVRSAEFDVISMVGLVLIVFSMFMLYTVTRLLKGIWTVKLMVAKNHKFNNHWLFQMVKHPNYFLNIIPELIGLVLLTHGFISGMILGPLYALVLYIRIKEENMVIRDILIPNGIVEANA